MNLARPVYAVYLHENDRYYAYATGNGGYFYRDTRGHTIGSLQAFFIGLPSVWSRYLLVLAMVLVPVLLFGPGLLRLANRYMLRRLVSMRLRVPRKGICLLVAFLMLFGPEHFHSLAQAEVQYANLSTASWAQGNRDIHYSYDDNGSLTEKITAIKDEPDPQTNFEEKVTNTYNLQNRLAQIVRQYDDTGDTIEEFTEYTYNDNGIRVSKHTWSEFNDTHQNDDVTVVYLVDSYNHTGYAQVLEEMTFNKADPDPLTETPDSLTTYVIGDDVIAQTKDGTTQYLLYDGHGSTRQLAEYDGSVTIEDSFSYDGYGVLLQDNAIASSNPGKVGAQQTSLLYAGEQFDTDAQQYYLRARYYNQNNGRFNRIDPFAGSRQDPQSLHKYLYAHCNPINGIDPSGMMTVLGITITFKLIAIFTAITLVSIFIIRGLYHSKRRDYGKYIGPEIYNWLGNYMYHEANRASNRISGLEGTWNSAASLGYMRERGGTWRTSGLQTDPPSNPKEVQSVQIFGQVVPSDVGGNIMYGFIGRVAQVELDNLLSISRMGDFRQKVLGKGYFRTNEPEDEAATSFGWELADEYIGGDGRIDWDRLDLSTFRQEFLGSEYLNIMTSPVQHLEPHSPPFVLAEPTRW